MTPAPSRRTRQIAIGAGATAIVAGVAAWALWPDPPRQREYLDATACLLTDAAGVASEAAKPVWSVMQAASVETLVKVQHLPIDGPQTVENAAAYLASLAGSRCNIIIAAGKTPVDTVTEHAAGYPALQFLVVGGGTSSANVHTLGPDPASLTTAIRDRFENLADDGS